MGELGEEIHGPDPEPNRNRTMILTVLFWLLWLLWAFGCFFPLDAKVNRLHGMIPALLLFILGLKVFGNPLSK